MSIDIPRLVAEGYSMLMGILRLVAFTSFMLVDIPKSAAEGGKDVYALGRDKKRAGKRVGCDSPPC